MSEQSQRVCFVCAACHINIYIHFWTRVCMQKNEAFLITSSRLIVVCRPLIEHQCPSGSCETRRDRRSVRYCPKSKVPTCPDLQPQNLYSVQPIPEKSGPQAHVPLGNAVACLPPQSHQVALFACAQLQAPAAPTRKHTLLERWSNRKTVSKRDAFYLFLSLKSN